MIDVADWEIACINDSTLSFILDKMYIVPARRTHLYYCNDKIMLDAIHEKVPLNSVFDDEKECAKEQIKSIKRRYLDGDNS